MSGGCQKYMAHVSCPVAGSSYVKLVLDSVIILILVLVETVSWVATQDRRPSANYHELTGGHPKV